jgi:hypothetical protein
MKHNALQFIGWGGGGVVHIQTFLKGLIIEKEGGNKFG